MPKKKHTRQEILARRDKSALPFGSTTASVKGTRNLVYLSKKGLLPGFPLDEQGKPTWTPSPRQAIELLSDNNRKANQAADRAATRKALAENHRKANEVAARRAISKTT